MAKSTGAQTQFAVQLETTYGVIPATPTLTIVPFSSLSLEQNQEEIVDSRRNGTRFQSNVSYGNKSVTGEVSADFSATDYDVLFQSFMMNDWALDTPAVGTDTIKVGTTVKSLYGEEAQLDITKYKKVTGLVANTLSVEVPIEGNATISFGLMGRYMGYTFTNDPLNSGNATAAGASVDADGYTAAVESKPFRHAGGTFSDDSGSIIGTVQSISLEGNNNFANNFVWGKDFVNDQVDGKAEVTGTLTAYYIDEVLMNKFLNGSATNITFSVTDGTSTYTFIMGKVHYTGAQSPVNDDSVRVITLPFRAVDPGNNDTPLKITRV